MRLAILAHKKDILLEIGPEVFRKTLIDYTEKEGDVGKAFDLICDELKQETRRI